MPAHRAALVAVAAVAAAVVLAGCSGNDATPVAAVTSAPAATLSPTGTASAAPVTVDPCSLVTDAELRDDFGGDVSDRQLNLTDPTVPTCTWAVTGSRLGTGTFRLAVTGTGGTATTFTAVQAAYPAASPVSGVGDRAYSVPTIGQLIVFQKGTTLTLAASGFTKHGADPSPSSTASVLTAVAGRAVTNL